MDLRSLLGSLQLPVAFAGGLAVAAAITGMAQVTPIPERGGLPGGLALIFLYVVAWGGVTLTALGLTIPPGDGVGIRFDRRQRALFALAAGCSVASGLLPLVVWRAFVATGGDATVIVVAWLAPAAVAVLSLVGGLGWRAAEAVAATVAARR